MLNNAVFKTRTRGLGLITPDMVDPYGMVFNSSTGDPLDGVGLTLVDAATGQPATVFGDDGGEHQLGTMTGYVADGLVVVDVEAATSAAGSAGKQ